MSLGKWCALSGMIAAVVAIQASASVVIEFPLSDPVEYERILGPEQVEAHSAVDMYVENILDPMRWKDWRIELWVPNTAAPITSINVDYDNTPDHSAPEVIFPVDLEPVTDPPPWPNFVGYYADTRLPQWEQYGTVPVGSPGQYDLGNPAWVSFHFDAPEGFPFGYYIWDECVPEPLTLGLLIMGGLIGLRKRR